MKKIVAYLQNPWFKPGVHQRHVALYRNDQKFHRLVLLHSATGRALERAFGSELYNHIHWDNANPLHGTERDAVFPPDAEYMAHVLLAQRPDIVLLFGKQAQGGWDKMARPSNDHIVLRSVHPMARGSAARHLEKIVRDLKMLIS